MSGYAEGRVAAGRDRGAMDGRQAVGAAVIGNILEWYDFAIYGYLATIIAKAFFPSADEVGALLSRPSPPSASASSPARSAASSSAASATPRGRKAALVLTIFMMAVGTVGIGLIPDHAAIGVLAPVLLVACRLMQGFSAGGEWGGSTAFIVEWAPPGRRGFFGSFQQASVALGLLLGSGVAALFSTVLTADQMAGWGWRIPFLIGAILVPVGVYMRRNIDETPAYRAAQEEGAEGAARPGGLAAGAGRPGLRLHHPLDRGLLRDAELHADLHPEVRRARRLHRRCGRTRSACWSWWSPCRPWATCPTRSAASRCCWPAAPPSSCSATRCSRSWPPAPAS